MSKRSQEHPRVRLEKVLGGFSPADAYSNEKIAEYGYGGIVEAQFFQDRSLPHLRLYWAVLHEVVLNSEQWPRAEDLHDALKVSMGYTRRITLMLDKGQVADFRRELVGYVTKAKTAVCSVCPGASGVFNKIIAFINEAEVLRGNVIWMPGSIALNKMDQADFSKFFDSAMNELRAAGYGVDDYIEQAKQKTYRHKASNLNRQSTPTNGEPSDNHDSGRASAAQS